MKRRDALAKVVEITMKSLELSAKPGCQIKFIDLTADPDKLELLKDNLIRVFETGKQLIPLQFKDATIQDVLNAIYPEQRRDRVGRILHDAKPVTATIAPFASSVT